MFEQLKQNFLASFESKIRHLEKALVEQDVQALSVSIHQLAGSSASYGFDDVSQLCGDIETLVEDSLIGANAQEKILQLIQLMRSTAKENGATH